jgi:hypothetical protein
LKIILFFLLSLSFISHSHGFVKDTLGYLNQKFFSSYGINIEKLNIEWKSESLLKKRLIISQKDLCLNITTVKNCFSQFQLDLSFNIPNLLDFEIEKLVIKTPKLIIKPPVTKGDVSEAMRVSDKLQMMRKWLVGKKLKLIDISIESLELHQQGKISFLSIQLSSEKIGSNAKGILTFKNSKAEFFSNILMDFKSRLVISLDNKLSSSELKAQFKMTLNLTDKKALLELRDITAKISDNYMIQSDGCKAKFNYRKPIPLLCQRVSLELHRKRSFFYNLALKAEVSDLIDFQNDNKLMKISITGEESEKSPYSLRLNSKLNLNIKNKKIVNELKAFGLKLAIPHFKRFVSSFKDSKFAVPSPFNALEGSVIISSSLKNKANILLFPIEGDMSLGENPDTKLEATLSSLLKMSTDFAMKSAKVDVVVNKLMFHTPYIDPIFGIPKITSTNKISKNRRENKEEPLEFKLDLSLATSSNQSIKVYNELFKPYLAFGFKSEINNEAASFDLDFLPGSKIVYLKREVEIKKINLKDKKNDSLIDGSFEYSTNGYLIKFNVVGTVDSPRLILSSFPSLSREDIISLLIYNRKSSELSSLDRSSVGSTQDAISNRALGLFSIWAFASTPIESVSYNPESKIYNAVVALPGNTSVNIGTTGETVSTLSFRKRLSESWAIVTTFEPSDENSKESVLLQKEVSY